VGIERITGEDLLSTSDRAFAEPPAAPRILRLLPGSQGAQALDVAAKPDIATILVDGPRTIEQLAADANADVLGRTGRFLTTFGIFRTAGDRIEVMELDTTLAGGRPDALQRALAVRRRARR
jgi:hypothetical protein